MGTKAFSAARLAEVGLVAAVYAVITWTLAPISYGQFQFRVSEILKSLVIWEPHLIPAFVLGNFISNLTSPYAGPWELIFMPAANLVGAIVCYIVGRRMAWLGAFLYALVISSAVSLMLSVITRVPFAVLLPGILLSETVLILGGLPIMRTVLKAVEPLRDRFAGTEKRAVS